MHVVDLGREAVPGATELLGRRRGRDRLDHLGIAPVALDARDEDVRGHRDQRRLERGALRGQRERDLAVIADLGG